MTTTAPPAVDQRTPVGWGRRLLRRPVLVALVAAVVGIVATPLGLALGVRYATKSGATATSVAGLLLLAVGLTLLGFATVVGWRTLHRWWRLALLPVAVVALVFIWSLAMGAMLSLAPRAALGGATPAARGLTYADVSFRTSDGAVLSAWLIPSRNSAAIVTVPGSGSTRTATLDQAAVLAGHGYGVLMIDPRGQGRSGGHAMDAGWYGERDITAAVTFLQHQPGVDPDRIGVLGLSMGGEAAIGAAAADPAVRAVVAEGATHRTAADKAGYLPGGVLGAIQRGIDKLTYGIADLLTSAPAPGTLHSAIARAHGTPFLLIAGGKVGDEPEAVAYLRSAAPERVQTWTVPGASHTHALATAPAQWTARVTAFFARALGLHHHVMD